MTSHSRQRYRIFADRNSGWVVVGLLSLVMVSFGIFADNYAKSNTTCGDIATHCISNTDKNTLTTTVDRPIVKNLLH